MRSFVNTASLTTLALPEHNAALAAPDELYSIQFNYQWRRLVTSALVYYYQHAETDLGLDNEDLLNSIIEDLYNAETSSLGMIAKTIAIDPGGNQTTTSASYVGLPGAGFYHTYSKANCLIRWSNIILNAPSAQTVTVKPNLVGLSPVAATEVRISGATLRTVTCAHVYEDVPAGSRETRLDWKVSSGTATYTNANYLLCEIIEWD